MNAEIVGQILANFFVASLVYYFLNQRLADFQKQNEELRTEIKELRDQHDEDMQKLIRRRGDTGRIPDLPPDEKEKAKKIIGLS